MIRGESITMEIDAIIKRLQGGVCLAGNQRATRNWADAFMGFLGIIAVVLLAYLSYRQLILPIQNPDDYSERMMLQLLALYIAMLACVIIIVRLLPDCLMTPLSVCMLIVFGLIQVYLAHEMQLMPNVDLSDIIEQNREMVETGEHIFTSYDYFSFYSNNIPIAIVIYWVYRAAHALGYSNYWLAGGLFNAVLNVITYACAWHIVTRYCSKKVSTVFLFFLVSNPILYAYASYYYTDTVSMSMTLVAVDLFVTGIHCSHRIRRCVMIAASGVVILFAYRVRATSLFILVAAGVYAILKMRWKDIMRIALPLMAGLIIASIFYTAIYHYHIDFDTTDTAAPWQHWVAMGAYKDNDGRFLSEDAWDTMGAPDHDSKVSINVEKWKNRVQENGITGNIELILNKEAVVWSYGCRMYFVYVPFVKDKNPIYEWIIGEHAEYLQHYMNAQNLSLLVLMMVSLTSTFLTRRRSGRQNILLIYWLGAVLFYVFWEAHPRQSVSYTTMMSMMVIPLFEQLCAVKKRNHV